MSKTVTAIQWALCLTVALLPVAWALNVPLRAGLLLYPEQAAGLMLGLAAASVYLRTVLEARGLRLGIDLFLAAVSLWVGLHVFLRFPVLSEGSFFHPEESLALGAGIALVSLEGLRRLGALSLVMILALLVIYALFSDLVPGQLQGKPIALDEIVRFVGVDSAATLGSDRKSVV